MPVWITGPSITGSENGMPISTASAPFAAAARIASCQPGYPPVMYGTSSLRPAAALLTELGLDATHQSPPGQDVHHLSDILVAATRQVDQHGLAPQGRGLASEPGDRVGTLERRDDALGL